MSNTEEELHAIYARIIRDLMATAATKYLIVMIILPKQQGLSTSDTCPLIIRNNTREQLTQTDHSKLYSCHSRNSSHASGLALNLYDSHMFLILNINVVI